MPLPTPSVADWQCARLNLYFISLYIYGADDDVMFMFVIFLYKFAKFKKNATFHLDLLILVIIIDYYKFTFSII